MSAQPSPMQTPDIGGLLRRPAGQARPATVPSAVAEPEPLPQPATTATARPRKQTARPQTVETARVEPPGRRAPARAETGRQYLRSIAVYLPRSLHQQVRTAATRQGTTATALMLAAVNSTHDRLAEAFARHSAEPSAAGDLFEIPQARRVAEPTVQTTIRVTDSQHRTLSELAANHEVNRSQLLATAVRLYLS